MDEEETVTGKAWRLGKRGAMASGWGWGTKRGELEEGAMSFFAPFSSFFSMFVTSSPYSRSMELRQSNEEKK